MRGSDLLDEYDDFVVGHVESGLFCYLVVTVVGRSVHDSGGHGVVGGQSFFWGVISSPQLPDGLEKLSSTISPGPYHHQRNTQLASATPNPPKQYISLARRLRTVCFSRPPRMGVWDAFTGRKSQPTSNAPSSSENIQDPAAGVSFNGVSSDDVGSFMNTPGSFDPSALHPLAGLNQDTLDYLTLDESALSDLPNSSSFLPSRGWSDDLCYGTGVAYLGALTLGGAWGLGEGLRRLPPTAPPKLRLNSVLNAVTRRGPFLGNSAGVVALLYNGLNSTLGYCRGQHDSMNSITAGAISGAIFKSTRGVRPAAISGAIVGSIAGGWALTRKMFFER